MDSKGLLLLAVTGIGLYFRGFANQVVVSGLAVLFAVLWPELMRHS